MAMFNWQLANWRPAAHDSCFSRRRRVSPWQLTTGGASCAWCGGIARWLACRPTSRKRRSATCRDWRTRFIYRHWNHRDLRKYLYDWNMFWAKIHRYIFTTDRAPLFVCSKQSDPFSNVGFSALYPMQLKPAISKSSMDCCGGIIPVQMQCSIERCNDHIWCAVSRYMLSKTETWFWPTPHNI